MGWLILVLLALLAPLYRFIVIIRVLLQGRLAPRIPIRLRPRGPVVSILVPARNEAHQIAECLYSLLAQQYEPFEVLVIDDASEDRTALLVEEIAESDSRVRLLRVDGPPPGWSGKNYALAVGAAAAKGEWLLFTDADTRHAPTALSAAVEYASRHGIGLLSLTGEQRTVGFWERIIQPVVFGLLDQWFPLSKVNDPGSPLAAANGIFILIRRDVYESVGGHRGVAGEILEDVALARAVKAGRFTLCFAQGQELVAARMYRGLRELRQGWTKNLFLLLDRKMGLTVMRAAELFLTGLFPALSLIAAVLIGGPALPLLALAVVMTLVAEGFYRARRGDDPSMAWSHPIGAACVLFFLLESMIRHRFGWGVAWKDRRYQPLCCPGSLE